VENLMIDLATVMAWAAAVVVAFLITINRGD
jgi:hypothetical protein